MDDKQTLLCEMAKNIRSRDEWQTRALAAEQELAKLKAWEPLLPSAGPAVAVVTEGCYEVPWHGIFPTPWHAERYCDFLAQSRIQDEGDGPGDEYVISAGTLAIRLSEDVAAFWNSYDEPVLPVVGDGL